MDQLQIKQSAVRLINLRAEILSKHPFFGRLLMRLPFGFAECGTAYTDMSRIVFDPAFASRLNDDQLLFVLLHELMHCVLKHCTRGNGKIHLLYNIACDIVVNSVLLEALNISSIKICDEEVMHLTPRGDEGRLYSAEKVYQMLIRIEDDKFQKAYGVSLFDCHANWDEFSSDALIEDVWDNYIKDVTKSVGNNTAIPEAISRMIEVVAHKSKISWRQVLHDYIQCDKSDFVFSSPDRRYFGEFILPSFQDSICGSKIDNIWYVVDTSGSVQTKEIAKAFGEIKVSIEQVGNVEGYVSFFDCEISEPIPFEKVEDIDSMIPVGGRGTSFKEIFNYLSNYLKDNLPKVIVIITDGYSDFPEESVTLGVPVIWLINSDVNPPFGEVIHIYENE